MYISLILISNYTCYLHNKINVLLSKMSVKIHKENDFIKMRAAGKLAAETLDFITDYVINVVISFEFDKVVRVLCAE